MKPSIQLVSDSGLMPKKISGDMKVSDFFNSDLFNKGHIVLTDGTKF